MYRLLLVAVLAGCSRPVETSTFRLRVAAVGDLAPMGPRPMDSFTSMAQDWVYQGLVRFEADGSTRLGLASRWERVDRSTVRLWIRPEARFSDGSPVAPSDVVDSLKSFDLDAYERDGAVVVESAAVLPESVFARMAIYKPAPGAILGTGPFSVVEQDASHILLRRNVPLPNHVEEVVIRAFPTPREAFLRTLAGDADVYPFIDPRQVEFFEGDPRFRVIKAPSPNAVALIFSAKRLDRNTRLALLATLRGSELARMAHLEGCSPMRSEPAAAASLPPGRPLRVAAVKSASHVERMALAVQRMLGPRGGDIEELSFAEHERRLATGDFDLLIVTPLAWPQSDQVRAWHTNSLLHARWYSNPGVDTAVDAGDWGRALQEMIDDPPVDYICLPERLAIVDARIKNARLGPYGFLETLPDWEIER